VGADPDIVVVGAGIVGLAAARELLSRGAGRVTVLEAAGRVGAAQTERNSGVVHAGIYYTPGSLKARLCVEGARRIAELCERHAIAYERCGKVIVATRPDELPRLDELERRGRANGVPGLRRLDAGGLREVEPSCAGIAALHSPATAITDFGAVARALAGEVESLGGELVLGCRVMAASRRAGRTVVRARRHGEEVDLRARRAIFCAGHGADRLAVASGGGADPRIVPFRGAYLTLRPHARERVRGLIYPVPDPALPFLGVHLSRHVGGEVWLGPTALLLPTRHGLTWPGTWRLLRRFWRTGLGEARMAVSRRAVVAAARRYVPELQAADVAGAGPAGVRAQAVGRDGGLVDDFLLGEAGGALHVRNAPSPGATSALALAALLAERAQNGRS
jgi:(S)-2-hydroxyglutarate dehydrogenase